MVLETVVDYNFCFPVGCNPPVFFIFILTFMGDAFLFDVTLGDLRINPNHFLYHILLILIVLQK